MDHGATSPTKRVLGGLVAGVSATLLMEYASGGLYSRQARASREREEELRREMPTTVLVKKLAGAAGAPLDDGRAQTLGMVTHYAFGAAGGPTAQVLMARGIGPFRAAMIVSGGMELLADQGANTALGLTAPSWRFPLVANARGALAHVAYAAALGSLLAAGRER